MLMNVVWFNCWVDDSDTEGACCASVRMILQVVMMLSSSTDADEDVEENSQDKHF